MNPPVYQYQVSKVLSLTGAFAVAHSVSPSRWLTIRNIHIANTSAAPVTVQVCFVFQGSSPIQGNSAIWNFSIPANDFIEWGDGQKLPPKSTVQASASANVINFWLSGIEEALPQA
jgi:hypothetical protein